MARFPIGVMASDGKELFEQLRFNESPPLWEDGILQVHREHGLCRGAESLFLFNSSLCSVKETQFQNAQEGCPTPQQGAEECRELRFRTRNYVGKVQFLGHQELCYRPYASGKSCTVETSAGFHLHI